MALNAARAIENSVYVAGVCQAPGMRRMVGLVGGMVAGFGVVCEMGPGREDGVKISGFVCLRSTWLGEERAGWGVRLFLLWSWAMDCLYSLRGKPPLPPPRDRG